MKVYYLQSNNRILKAIYDREVYETDLTTMSPYNIIDVEETEENKARCLDLKRTINMVDIENNQKYLVKAGKIEPKENWVEYTEEQL